MEDAIMQLSPAALVLVPIVMGVVQVCKGFIPERFVPASSLIFGVASAFLIPVETWQQTVITGLGIGLMASGTYSSFKTTFTHKE